MSSDAGTVCSVYTSGRGGPEVYIFQSMPILQTLTPECFFLKIHGRSGRPSQNSPDTCVSCPFYWLQLIWLSDYRNYKEAVLPTIHGLHIPQFLNENHVLFCLSHIHIFLFFMNYFFNYFFK